MEPLAVDLVLLRSAAPDLLLAVGRVLPARVVERRDRHGILNLAGALLTAELPDEIKAGDRLRLVVRETTAERVVLALAGHREAGHAQVPPPVDPPLRGAPKIAVLEREPEQGAGPDGRSRAVMLRCEAPGLGTVVLRVALDDRLVHVRAALAEGPPLELARANAEALRAALSAAAGRPAEVDVVARPDPLDVYA